jgi:hypothetical protein
VRARIHNLTLQYAKISDFTDILVVHEDILRFDVSMADLSRLQRLQRFYEASKNFPQIFFSPPMVGPLSSLDFVISKVP